MAKQAPYGPLLGSERVWAIKLLTDQQLRAYRYRREGQALNWIAQRLGVSRPRVVHLIAAAEKRLGYEPTVAAKQKSPYKSVATRRTERESAWDAYQHELIAKIPPRDLRRLARVLETSASDGEAKRRLKKRLDQLVRERRRLDRQDDLSSTALHRGEDGLAADLEADFGTNPVTGMGMRA